MFSEHHNYLVAIAFLNNYQIMLGDQSNDVLLVHMTGIRINSKVIIILLLYINISYVRNN